MKLLYLNQQFQRANVSVRSGKATFLDDNNLRLFDVYGYWKELTAKHVVIATGSRPRFFRPCGNEAVKQRSASGDHRDSRPSFNHRRRLSRLRIRFDFPRFGIDRNPGGKGTTTFARLG
jgi:hypothetical protein